MCAKTLLVILQNSQTKSCKWNFYLSIIAQVNIIFVQYFIFKYVLDKKKKSEDYRDRKTADITVFP